MTVKELIETGTLFADYARDMVAYGRAHPDLTAQCDSLCEQFINIGNEVLSDPRLDRHRVKPTQGE